jgi:hypothetical protein
MNDYQNLIQKKKDDDRKNAEGKIGNFWYYSIYWILKQ